VLQDFNKRIHITKHNMLSNEEREEKTSRNQTEN